MEMATCDGCDGCGQRCVAGFTVTREEHRAVQDYLAAQPAAEVARVLNQNKVAPWPGDDAGTGATFTFCRYRDRDHDNCFVYPARPTVCRLFGHTPWLPCPIEAVAQVRTAPPRCGTSTASGSVAPGRTGKAGRNRQKIRGDHLPSSEAPRAVPSRKQTLFFEGVEEGLGQPREDEGQQNQGIASRLACVL
jgi:hypothetical protein